MKLHAVRSVLIGVFVLITVGTLYSSDAFAQASRKSKAAKVCPDPTIRCKTTVTFEANDMPFQIPENAGIWESEQFYAIILKSVASPNGDCETFVSESERLAAQSLFPKMKVFTSRCVTGGSLYYTNVAQNQEFMAVFAGLTKAQANRMLVTVKGTGKFPGANIRRMNVGFNGT